MKATELRIGNLVYLNDETPYSIVGISTDYITAKSYNHETTGDETTFKPIPLTEEWLERFGFEKLEYETKHGYCVEYHLEANEDTYMVYLDDFSLGLYPDKKSAVKQLAVIPEWNNITHVHQLQNLYFALTGEELQTDETDQIVNQ